MVGLEGNQTEKVEKSAKKETKKLEGVIETKKTGGEQGDKIFEYKGRLQSNLK